MRIFQLIDSSSNSAVPDNSVWYRNLYEPLVDMGHDVYLMSSKMGIKAMASKDKKAIDTFSNTLYETFIEEHKRKPFSLFFSYLMDGMIDVSVIDEIRKTGVPTFNFSCNNIHQFFLVDEISPHFDFCLHSERDSRIKFIDIGANPVWFQMAANPKYYHPIELPRTIPVSFVGMNYARRANYISYLLNNDVNVQVFGPGWDLPSNYRKVKRLMKRNLYLLKALTAFKVQEQAKNTALASSIDSFRLLHSKFENHFHSSVSDERMVQLYSQSNISLGFIEVFEGHDPSLPITYHLHLREFEAPMSGALYCTGYCDELSDFYIPDEEVIVYRNEFELIEKVRFYLKHEYEGNKIRTAGRRRALECHTYHKRFKDLFSKVGL